MGGADDATERAAERARESFSPDVDPARVVFGVDGFLDHVREVVADRETPDSYERLDTLEALAERLSQSVERESSLTFEWRQTGTRTGGHTAHLARIFGGWGFDPVMVGTYGDPEREAFASEFADCERFTLGEPGYTDAVEFDDGKLMLCEIGATTSIDWATIDERMGHDALADRLDGAALLGLGYWSDAPALPGVLDGLCELWDDLADPPSQVLLDPGDVRKLDADRLRTGRDAISALSKHASVVVSANRAETARFATVFDDETDDQTEAAEAAYDALGPSLFVSHGVDRSMAVSADGIASVSVPHLEDPTLTTSAGDHFNAGLALALLDGLDPAPALAVGNTVAREFVRTGTAPSLSDVRSFLAEYENAC